MSCAYITTVFPCVYVCRSIQLNWRWKESLGKFLISLHPCCHLNCHDSLPQVLSVVITSKVWWIVEHRITWNDEDSSLIFICKYLWGLRDLTRQYWNGMVRGKFSWQKGNFPIAEMGPPPNPPSPSKVCKTHESFNIVLFENFKSLYCLKSNLETFLLEKIFSIST